MGSKLPDDQARLYRRVDELLHYLWDPIGVAGTPEARDEYQSYAPRVFKMIVDEVPVEHIKNYLIRIETENMGLSMPDGRLDHLDSLLEALVAARDLLLDDAPVNQQAEQGGGGQAATRTESA
jgi:hypothetical protein